MGNNGTAGVLSLSSQSTGLGFGALLALAPATVLSLAMPAELQSALVSIQMPHAQVSTWTMAPVVSVENSSDEQLRKVAADAFTDLLQRQSDTDPDIAAIIYGNRAALYSSTF